MGRRLSPWVVAIRYPTRAALADAVRRLQRAGIAPDGQLAMVTEPLDVNDLLRAM